MNTSGARSMLESTDSSPSRRAMMMLVSRGNLPLAGVNALALLLDRRDHLPSRHGIYRGCESAKARPLLAHRRRSGQGSHEAEHLLLRLQRQFFDLPGDLLPNVHLPVPSTSRIHAREPNPRRFDASRPSRRHARPRAEMPDAYAAASSSSPSHRQLRRRRLSYLAFPRPLRAVQPHPRNNGLIWRSKRFSVTLREMLGSQDSSILRYLSPILAATLKPTCSSWRRSGLKPGFFRS